MALQDFVKDVIVKVIADPQTKQAIKDILGELITERILPIIPVASAAAAVEAITSADLNRDGKPDLAQVTDAAAAALDQLIPNITFPGLGQLADFWRPRG